MEISYKKKNNKRTLFLSLTIEGEGLKEKARNVPAVMKGCIPLTEDELFHLRELLDKVLAGMDEKDQKEN